MIPKKNEVIQKARELYVEHCYKSGTPELADVNPEDSELVESGFYSSALSSLMTSEKRKYAEYMNGSEDLPIEPFSFNVSEAMQTTTFISGSRGVGKSDVSMRIVDQLTSEGIICVAFDSSMDWLKRSSISRYVTIKPYSDLKIPDQNTIIDMSMLTPNQQQAIVERFCEKLFEHQITDMANKYYLVFEESQLYFPLNSIRAKRYQYTTRVLTVGRNVNVSICAISQFPSLIDCELRKNAQQIYIGCTSEKNTLAYWKGMLGKNADQLKDLQNGEFIYYCRNKLSKIQIDVYENHTTKTRIAIPEPTLTPITLKPKQTDVIALLNLAVVGGFMLIVLSQILNR
jgi:hypothetical protein